MKLKIKLTKKLCIIGIVSILLTSISSVVAFWFVFSDQAKSDIETYCSVLAKTLKGDEKPDTLSDYVVDGYRITLVSKEGDVLFESDSDLSCENMDNHKDRPEITQAMETGKGISDRTSETMGKVTYYNAQRLENGNVLRVSKEASNIFSMFYIVIPIIIAIAIYVFIVCLIMASEFTKGIVRPIEQMAVDAESSVYDELRPFAKTIENQKREINRQVENIQQQNDKISAIIANMAEGLILLDTDKNILMENESARVLLDIKGYGKIKGKNIFELCDSQVLLECVSAAAAGKSQLEETKVNGNTVQLIVNPVYTAGEQTGIICLIMDITGRKKTEKLRREFTANVSHELKTPLTSISGYAEMIENGMVKQEEDIKKFAGKIHKEAGRLVSLISDIIKLSKLDDKTVQDAEFQRVNLKDIIFESVETLEISASKNNIDITADAEDCYINGNSTRLFELIYNLCDNAIRYNKPGGSVIIKLNKKDGRASLVVQDTGIGIPDKHIGRVFERFYRVDKSRSKETGGTGLGLAIVKHIAEQHNADLEIESTVGKGTKIKIEFNCEE